MQDLQSRIDRLFARLTELDIQLEEQQKRDPHSMRLALVEYDHKIVCQQLKNLRKQQEIEAMTTSSIPKLRVVS